MDRTAQDLKNAFRGASSSTVNNIVSGADITKIEKGIRLKFLTASSKQVDLRVLRAKKIANRFGKNTMAGVAARDGVNYVEFQKELTLMEEAFARSFYIRVRRAYAGTGSVKLQPLSKKARRLRSYFGISGDTPYLATGSFRNAITLDKRTNTVYLRKGKTTKLKKARSTRPGNATRGGVDFLFVWKINEFGGIINKRQIPARPVFRPIARQLVAEYSKEYQRLLAKYF